MTGEDYWGWAFTVGVLIFGGVWIYAMSEWGILIGIIFGWIPALIAAIVTGILWPLTAIVVVGLIILVSSL